jgi:alpha-L-fucosidase
LYSLLARGEWVMHHEKIPVSEYEALMPQFNPVKFNAEEWVRIAADAGQKYIVITSISSSRAGTTMASVCTIPH